MAMTIGLELYDYRTIYNIYMTDTTLNHSKKIKSKSLNEWSVKIEIKISYDKLNVLLSTNK